MHIWLCGARECTMISTIVKPLSAQMFCSASQLACVSCCLQQQSQVSSSLIPGMDDEAGCTPQSTGGDNMWTSTSVFDVSGAGADDAGWPPSSMCEILQSEGDNATWMPSSVR